MLPIVPNCTAIVTKGANCGRVVHVHFLVLVGEKYQINNVTYQGFEEDRNHWLVSAPKLKALAEDGKTVNEIDDALIRQDILMRIDGEPEEVTDDEDHHQL